MLPFSLKIILAILGVLLVLLFVIKKRKFIWILIILNTGLGIWLGLKEYNRSNKDFSNVTPDIKIAATDLIREYETDNSTANKKFLGKILETIGTIKDIIKDKDGYYTIVIGDTSNLSSVRCSMDTVHQQDAADLLLLSSVSLRGACTGFNEDEMGLGSDVILNRCVVVQNKN